MLAFTCGFFQAACNVATRVLKTAHPPVILFFHTSGGVICTLIFLLVEMWITGNPLRLFSYDASTILVGFLAACFDATSLIFLIIAF